LYFFYTPYTTLCVHSQLINAPEGNQVLPEIPVLGNLVKNLYEYHNDKFFVALGVFFPRPHPVPLNETNHPIISSNPGTNTPHPIAPPLPARAFLHKRNGYSRIHATTRELSKSNPGQPVFGVWGWVDV
jgi:hypothetical protein